MPRGLATKLWKDVVERITALEPSAVPLTPAENLERILAECHTLTNVQRIEQVRHFIRYLDEPIPFGRVQEVVLPHLTREFVLTSLADGALKDMLLDDLAERAKRHERLLKIIGPSKSTLEESPVSGSRGKDSVTCTICGKAGRNASRCWHKSKKSSKSTSATPRANRVTVDGKSAAYSGYCNNFRGKAAARDHGLWSTDQYHE